VVKSVRWGGIGNRGVKVTRCRGVKGGRRFGGALCEAFEIEVVEDGADGIVVVGEDHVGGLCRSAELGGIREP
jgi:hypothetical protein